MIKTFSSERRKRKVNNNTVFVQYFPEFYLLGTTGNVTPQELLKLPKYKA